MILPYTSVGRREPAPDIPLISPEWSPPDDGRMPPWAKTVARGVTCGECYLVSGLMRRIYLGHICEVREEGTGS